MKSIKENAAQRSGNTQIDSRVCPTCGAEKHRGGAKFCSRCGNSLTRDYFPTEHLRASYSMLPAPNRFLNSPRRARPSGAFRFSEQDWRTLAILSLAAFPLLFIALFSVSPLALIAGSLLFIRCEQRNGRILEKRGALLALALGILMFTAQIVVLVFWIL
jgi:hypothetical protein